MPAEKKSDIDALTHPMLWRGKDLLSATDLNSSQHAVFTSGYAELDRHLLGGGWPQQGLVDLLLPQAGIGELRLILPVLQQLTQNAYVVWINPPFIPYATALEACGVNTRNILVVRTRSHEDTLWGMERCCLSSGCAGVLAWPEERKLNIKETRRIQLAARSGRTLALFFRPISAITRSSLAELRLALRPAHSVDRLSLDIIKRKGGWPVNHIELCLAEASQTSYDLMQPLHEQLALWQKQGAQEAQQEKPHETRQETRQETQQERKTTQNKEQENALYSDFAHDMNPAEPDMAANNALH